MAGGWTIDAIAQAFSAAALGTGTWQDALEVVCEETDGMGAALLPLRGAIPKLPATASFQEAIDAYMKDGWVHADMRFRGLDILLRRGVATDLDFISAETIAREPYYQEWLRPFGLKWFAGVRIDGFEETWALSLQRRETQLPFDREECRRLQDISRTMSDAARLGNALGFGRIDAALRAFEISGKAVVMLNRRGDVIRFNKSADASFGSDLFVQGKRLMSSNPEAMKALERAIHISTAALPHSITTDPILLPRKDMQPVIAHVMQAQGAALDIFSPCQIFIVLDDLARRRPLHPAGLRKLFGLTPAEAKLAYRIACGERLQDLSQHLGISYETSRTQLRSIFSKVGVSNQADLVASLVRIDTTPQ